MAFMRGARDGIHEKTRVLAATLLNSPQAESTGSFIWRRNRHMFIYKDNVELSQGR